MGCNLASEASNASENNVMPGRSSISISFLRLPLCAVEAGGVRFSAWPVHSRAYLGVLPCHSILCRPHRSVMLT